jgi:FkbM family methyltransferase
MRTLISKILLIFLPKLFWTRKKKYYTSVLSETEMYLLPILNDNTKIAIDIGGAHGTYTANLSNVSKYVNVFEPIPKNIKWINNLIKYNHLNAFVHEFALSDSNGVQNLSMVEDNTGFSTLEKENDLTKHNHRVVELNVQTKRLDDLNFKEVGFIKIDVEGHEVSVLNGAINTISNSLPNLLIEIEERHKKGAINSCIEILKKMNYECFFIFEGNLLRFDEFNLEIHQNEINISSYEHFNIDSKRNYSNNFIFIPKSKAKNFIIDSQNVLSSIKFN